MKIPSKIAQKIKELIPFLFNVVMEFLLPDRSHMSTSLKTPRIINLESNVFDHKS